MAVTSGSTSSRPAKRAKGELNRNDSGPSSSSRSTPISSTEGEYEDEEEDDEEEDEEEDDDVEEEEEEEPTVDNVRFDEQFLAQLLAFDSSLAGQSIPNNALSQVNNQQQDRGPSGNINNSSLPMQSYNEPTTRHTPSGSAILPLSAPTPSNEFYDGAINFLTEVLGSSTPNFWTGDANLAQSNGNANWSNTGNTPAASLDRFDFAAPEFQAAKGEFKNLQPLINNLIARLKGVPIQEGQQIGQTLEDDLVILLQSLMAHRQAQQNRQAQEQLDSMLRNAPLNTTSSTSTTPAINGQQSRSIPNDHLFPSETGFSIVDFDFGDDDDDPDFIPNNVNLDFANSKDFADALAQVSAAPIAPLPVQSAEGEKNNVMNVDDASWQHVMNALQPGGINGETVKETTFASPWNESDSFRRTRSTTRNGERSRGDRDGASTGPSQTVSPAFEHERSQSRGIDYERGESIETDHDKSGRPAEKKRGRKPRDRQEALERRRESNRECSRRNRLRKKQEEEEIRQEFLRIQQIKASQETTSDLDRDDERLPVALRKKRQKGRPLGSKSFAHREESEGATRGGNDETVADLKADNRMLRAEMQRLIEENARLRARMLRVQEEEPSPAAYSKIGRDQYRRRDDRRSRRYDDHDDDEEDSLSSDAENFLERSRAARLLPYDPIKSLHPPVSSRRSLPSKPAADESNGVKRKRNEGPVRETPASSIEQLLRGFAAYQQTGVAALPPSALPDQYPAMNQRRGQVG